MPDTVPRPTPWSRHPRPGAFGWSGPITTEQRRRAMRSWWMSFRQTRVVKMRTGNGTMPDTTVVPRRVHSRLMSAEQLCLLGSELIF